MAPAEPGLVHRVSPRKYVERASPRFRHTSTISVVALPYTWSGLRLAASRVVEEIIAGGSTLVKVIRGQGRLKSYCAIFRKPEAGP